GFFVVNLVQHARCTVTAGLLSVAGQFFDSSVTVCPPGHDVLGESCARAAVARQSPVDRTAASAAHHTRERLVDVYIVSLPSVCGAGPSRLRTPCSSASAPAAPRVPPGTGGIPRSGGSAP